LKAIPHGPNNGQLQRLMNGFYNRGAILLGEKRYKETLICWEPLVNLGVNIPQMVEVKRQINLPTDNYAMWKAGIHSEVIFWKEWLGKVSLDRSSTDRLDARMPLQATLCRLLELSHPKLDPSTNPLEILDIGSGPLTSLGKYWSKHPIQVSAADPLAQHYNQALDEGYIVPPVRVIEAQAEKLTSVFPKSSFDLITAINCLDQSYDPLQAILQAVQVVKPGCFILLAHELRKGENKAYLGLHKWNFDLEDGDFVIWSPPTKRYNVTAALRHMAEVTCEITGTGEFIDSTDVLTVRIKKHAMPFTRSVLNPTVSVLILCHNYSVYL